ncbi:MAG: zf-TFIIB domain-containing protein [Acidobacteria bacterium]|nr:zf-TFIIB domain-containing protein [Candidatus Sulfomarinibacter kjeldsenii]
MKCPSCTSEMSEESRGGVRLDLCGVCFGVWFDGGELEALQTGGGSPRLSGVPGPGASYEPTGGSAHVKCPRCERDILRTGRISKHEVIRCTSCRGLFLPKANSRFKTSEDSIIDSAIGVLEEIVGALF